MVRTLAAFGAVLLFPGLLEAQIVPGAPPPDRNAAHAQFLDAVIQGVHATATKWVVAWSKDDVATVKSQYVDGAFVITPEGNMVSGRDSLDAYLEGALARTGPLETFLVEVDASDRMAMTLERYVMAAARPGDGSVHGFLLTLYKSDGRTWRIRSQVFRPAPVGG